MRCMKTKRWWTRNFLVLSSVAVMSAFSLSSCDKDNDDNNNANGNYTISGNASGSQMVPSVAGNGSATINGTYNPNTGVMTYTTNWTNLTGGPTSGGFYSGASGTNGTLVGSNWNMGSGLTGTGNYSGTMTLNQD